MSIEKAVALIDRHKCIAENVDALGKKWEIRHVNATSLYVARPDPDREDAVIPEEMRGKWTKPSDLQIRIDLYLERSWDKAELAKVKADRKVAALAEAKEVTTEDLPLAESKSVDVFTQPSEEAQASEDAAVAEILVSEDNAGKTDSQESVSSEQGT